MINPIIRIVTLGVLGGVFLFAIPFLLLKLLLCMLIFRLILNVFRWRRHKSWRHYHPYYYDPNVRHAHHEVAGMRNSNGEDPISL